MHTYLRMCVCVSVDVCVYVTSPCASGQVVVFLFAPPPPPPHCLPSSDASVRGDLRPGQKQAQVHGADHVCSYPGGDLLRCCGKCVSRAPPT